MGESKDIKKDILWRVGIVYAVILLFGITIVGRILYLQVVEGSELRSKAVEIAEREDVMPTIRGNIYAADGRLLASSVPYYEIRMDLMVESLTDSIFNANIDSLSICLSGLFKTKTSQEYKRELKYARKNKSRYKLIKRKATYIELKELKTFPIFRLGKYKGGLIAIEDNRRVKPFTDLAARTIGDLKMDTTERDYPVMVGRVGLEEAFDEDLKGVEGLRIFKKTSGNGWVPLSKSGDNEVDPIPGKDIYTTIDINIQDVAEEALYKQLKKHNAKYGTAILMEVKTGEIKAIANLKLNKKKDDYFEGYNYGIGASIEPGSTFKLMSLMIALDDGYVDLNDTIETGNGKAKFHGFTVTDSHEGGYGNLSVQEVFEKSSNVGIAKIVDRYYCQSGREKDFVDELYRMGLNEPLGVEIKGEGMPLIKYPEDEDWSGVSLVQMSYGYETRMTPLQILTFYNAIANNGTVVKPKFVKEVRFNGHVEKSFGTEIIRQLKVQDETIRKARVMLEGVVENGTAVNMKTDNYKFAGKTGTAKIYDEKLKKYVRRYNASFVGYFPAGNPKYSCIVLISSPSNSVYYGSYVAGPVFREIADKVYATSFEMHLSVGDDELMAVDVPYSKDGYKTDMDYVFQKLGVDIANIELNSNWVNTITGEADVAYKSRNINTGLVPSVKGMGLKDAMFVLENAGLEVSVIGRGTVKRQSLKPGSRIVKGKEITLELS